METGNLEAVCHVEAALEAYDDRPPEFIPEVGLSVSLWAGGDRF
jgi:hypothetical protein